MVPLNKILARIVSAISTRSSRREPAISDGWITDEVEALFSICRFVSDTEPFLLAPEVFDSVGNYKDQVVFLLRRHSLPHADVAIYMHAGLKLGSKACSGLAHYPVSFDTSRLGAHQTLLSVNRDGTYTVLDSSDPERRIIRSHSTPVALAPARGAILLNQAFVGQKEPLAGIIAHEVAHLYLYYRGVHTPSLSPLDLIDEYRTDLAMFVMGLGLIALRASSTGLGYLSYRQMRLAQERVATLAGLTGSIDR